MRVYADTDQVQPPQDQIDLVVEIFRLLADPTRVRLLWAMRGRECSVNDLAAAVDKRPTGVSQHLAKLRMGRLASTRRDGQQVFYRAENAHVANLVEDAIYHADHNGPGIRDHHRNDSVPQPPGNAPDPERSATGPRLGVANTNQPAPHHPHHHQEWSNHEASRDIHPGP